MPIQIVRNDITLIKADAIVNAVNPHFERSDAGVQAAILRSAGPELMREMESLGVCSAGHCKITGGYGLLCRYLIHTVGPVWQGGYRGEDVLLAACYQNSLLLAVEKGCRSIAFPLISTGHYGFPREEAMQIAMRAIQDFLKSRDEDLDVTLVVYDDKSYFISKKLYSGVETYISARYVSQHGAPYRESRIPVKETDMMQFLQMPPECCSQAPAASVEKQAGSIRAEETDTMQFLQMPPECCSQIPAASVESECSSDSSLEQALAMVDESFSRMVLRKIDEKGMKDADCYKKANLDRKHFSKIRSDEFYRPKKTTAMAIAIALRLTRPETDELLLKAGYALSRSSRMDIILEYCIDHGIYDIGEVNSILFSFDQPTLGA